MLASNAVSHIHVTIEASDPAERERSGNWKILTVSFTQSGSSVKKWSPRRRTATVCVTHGALHMRSRALSLHAISKAGRAFSFVSGATVCQIRGRSYGLLTTASLQREGAYKSQRSVGFSSFQALPGSVALFGKCRSGPGWPAVRAHLSLAVSAVSGG